MSVLDRILGRRDRATEERLRRGVGAVDRELAANLELAAMFDQTHQAAVFENGEFARHRDVLAHELPEAFSAVSDVYARIPQTETAMERRGPAGSVRPEDRAAIEAWEGDVRAAQRAMRDAAAAGRPSLVGRLRRRLRRG